MTKQTVWNMTISADLGGGYMMQNTGDNSLLFTLGINEKIFFTRNFGIRADLRGMFYQQMDIIAQVPTKKNLMNTELTIGIVYLFPTLD